MNRPAQSVWHRRPAFTSVEVLAATALASLLMVAVLGVLGGIAKKERLLERTVATPFWHDQLARQLAADLRHARTLRRQPGRLILSGHGGTVAGEPTWEETEVHYYAVQTKAAALLLRQEFPAPLAGPPGPPEVLHYGNAQLELVSYYAAPATSSDAAAVEPLRDGVLPSRLAIVLLSAADEDDMTQRPQVLFRKALVLY